MNSQGVWTTHTKRQMVLDLSSDASIWGPASPILAEPNKLIVQMIRSQITSGFTARPQQSVS